MGVCTQLPETLHTSIVQGLESSQSPADRQREQLEAAWVLSQTPALQASVVHASPSLQSATVLHAMQSGTGSCEQTLFVEQVSVVQALLTMTQSASVLQVLQPPSATVA